MERRVRLGVLAAAAAVGAVAWIIQLARLGLDMHGNPFDVVFSEDGQPFLPDAQQLGPSSLGYSFAGYGHLLPRLVVLLGAHLPLTWYAGYCALAATATISALTALTFVAAESVVGRRRAAMVALAIVLVPAIGWESLGVVANIQWFAIPTAAWFLISAERPWLARSVVLVAALTSPLVVLAIPALFVHRRWWRHPALPALGIGLAVQVVYVLAVPSSGAGPDRRLAFGPSPIVRALEFSTTPDLIKSPRTIVLGCVISLLLLPALGVLIATRWSRLAGLLTMSGLAALLIPSFITGQVTGRYVGLATTFFAMAAMIGVREGWTPLRAIAMSTVVASVVVCFPASSNRVDARSWTGQVSEASDACARSGVAPFVFAPRSYFAPTPARC